MFVASTAAQTFAYVIVVEADDALRDLILQNLRAPNCAVDVARGADEAVNKALAYCPRLLIVKQHLSLEVDLLHLLTICIASWICCRARLSRAVRLVTHSDDAITIRGQEWPLLTFNGSQFCVLARPVFENQRWRKEWYCYCTPDVTIQFFSANLRCWLGVVQTAPILGIIRLPGSLLPWVQPFGNTMN
jgi:hypothetical protein